MIKFLKDTGQYDNTLIIFVADNGTSEPGASLNIKFSSMGTGMADYLKSVNQTLPNLGNVSSQINYGDWGQKMPLLRHYLDSRPANMKEGDQSSIYF